MNGVNKKLADIFGLSSRSNSHAVHVRIASSELVWAMGSFCALHRKPFDAALVIQQHPGPYTAASVIQVARALDFRVQHQPWAIDALASLVMPCLVLLAPSIDGNGTAAPEALAIDAPPVPHRLALLCQANAEKVGLFHAGSNVATEYAVAEFATLFASQVFQIVPAAAAVGDPDAAAGRPRGFGFRWFIPELFKYRSVWRDVLAASLVIQLLALATPLFTQVVVDKVVVHHTQSTLIAIVVGMAIFLVFSQLLTWVRQYLILHTGNRVDAVLGAAVFDHLLKLPPRYFEQRPTGVIAARLRGVENIREFIASAGITLVLDLPFLLVFVAVMFDYSVWLTVLTLGLIALIVLLSLMVAPIFRAMLNEQFLIGARNQAFTTEYIAGMDTVKSLQMEPQLRTRYADYLAQYLGSGFAVRQVANTYNVLASSIEQLMTLLNDTLTGGTGIAAIEGGGAGGHDLLRASSNQAALMAGSGSSTLTGGAFKDFFAAGLVGDTITTGATANVISINRGAGADIVNPATGAANVLSFGGGIDTEGLYLTKSGNNLVLTDGVSADSTTFINWYSSASNQDVTKLQVVELASASYSASGSDKLRNQALEEFNFTSLVSQFNAAGSPNSWALSNGMLSAQLASSATAAYGGDLAYYDGLLGNVTGMNLSAVYSTFTNASFATAAQTVDAWASITGSSITLLAAPSVGAQETSLSHVGITLHPGLTIPDVSAPPLNAHLPAFPALSGPHLTVDQPVRDGAIAMSINTNSQWSQAHWMLDQMPALASAPANGLDADFGMDQMLFPGTLPTGAPSRMHALPVQHGSRVWQ